MPLTSAPIRLVKWMAYASGASVRQAHSSDAMRILMLHGVGDAYYPADVLAQQLDWLRRNFEVISLDDAVTRLADGTPPTGREIVLTFDDGLKNNATVAAPLLQRHALPATFFLCPGLIEDEAWIWNVEARERLTSLRPAALEEVRHALALPLADDMSPDEVIEGIVLWMKAQDLEQRETAEDVIRAATRDWQPTAAQRQANDMMSWEDVQGLDPALITIGSHTVHHPTLTTLDDDDLAYEIVESKALLEGKLDRPVDLFCYPSGIEDARVRAAVAHTYRAAVTVEAGIVEGAPDLHRLPRVGAVPSKARLAWRLNRP